MRILFFILAIEEVKHNAFVQAENLRNEICFRKTIASSEPQLLDDICASYGVTCRNREIWKISWTRSDKWMPKHFPLILKSLDWLPPSLRKIQVDSQTDPKKLITRLLPRVLKFCSIRACGINGTVDLRTLPEPLSILDLALNLISGTAVLTKLPENIRFISLASNPIRKVIVDNESLPKSLVDANIFDINGKARIITTDGSVVDSRVGIFFSKGSERYNHEYDGW